MPSGTPSIAAAELEQLHARRAPTLSCSTAGRSTNIRGCRSRPRSTCRAPSWFCARARSRRRRRRMVVVNCAGRTRSIIGAQSLINAGLPNKVVALRNGTMGWSLAGFTCDSGKNRRAPDVSAKDSRLGATRRRSSVAQQLRRRTHRSRHARRLGARTRRAPLYLFDVRDPAEYAAGHVAGAISAPGGQLVQATDQYVGTLGARIVLVDDAEVRAVMTGVVAAPNGLEGCFRAGRGRNGDRLAGSRRLWTARPQSSGAIDLRRARRAARRATPPRSSICRSSRDYLRGPHSRRLVCDPHAARSRAARKFRCAERWCSRPKTASLARLAVAEAEALVGDSGALSRRRQRGVAGGRLRALDRAAYGRRSGRSMAQALRAQPATPRRR